MAWQLQEAKNKLSQVIERARSSGPQSITVRGRSAAVIISAEDYRRLTRGNTSLVEFLRQSPWAEIELDIERPPETGRDVDL